MVAQSKHHKAARRKQHSRARPRKAHAGRLSAPPPLAPARIAPEEEEIPKEDEEPKPEDLAKEEETLKAAEPDAVPLVMGALSEEAAGPRTRDRSSYDGDTAIKLYLREIGQVKLLTPQEEIELAARIKKGDKKAREQMIKANLRLVV